MSKTTRTILKILRAVLIIISIVCAIAVFGMVGKLEISPDTVLAYYTKSTVTCCIASVVSLLLAKISDVIIKSWR